MKFWKILVTAVAVTTMSTLAFASNASATTLTGPSGETTPTIHMVNEGAHMEMHNSISNTLCNLTVEGPVNIHGAGATALVNVSTFLINNCTTDWDVAVLNKGTLALHYLGVGSGHGEGTLTSSGATLTSLHTATGLTCGYLTNNTDIGTVTGGNPATLHIELTMPRHAGSFLCGGSTARWTGSLATTKTLKIDP